MDTLEFIQASKIITICRKVYGAQLEQLAGALAAGGIKLIEVTFDQADPDCVQKTTQAIAMLNEKYGDQMMFGAGTVLTREQVKAAADAGGRYIISPNTDPEIIAYTKELGLVSMPGAMTPSEIITANPQVADPDLIYPGESLNIPQLDQGVLSFEAEVVRLVNAIRRESGLGELGLNWELSRVARYKSQDMADNFYFSHTSPTYGSPFQMIRAFGLTYRTAGENIAYGYPTPQAVVNSWMNSEGHRKNILNPSFTQIGVGYVSQGNHWTQMFIG